MEIVIRIPKEYYNAIKAIPDNQCTFDMLVIKNGKQLPKGHGRLKDMDRLESHDEYDGQGFTKSVYKDDIDVLPTIIEAESEE